MGSSYEFECMGCGYKVEVSGGKDRGMLVFTKTVQCLDCKTLSDVSTGRVVEKTQDGKEIVEETEAKCRHCGSANIIPWDGKTCPKCGSEMVRGKNTMMWD